MLRLERKIMAKKTKFNLMDCLIILVVAAVIAGGLYVIGNLRGSGSNEGGGGAETVTIRYTVELAKEDKELAHLFAAAAERGDRCYVGEKEKAEAVIKEVICTPATLLNNDTETGEAFWAEIPGKYCINVTLESTGTESDSDIKAGGGAVLKVGDETSVKGKGYAGYGFITALETVKD